MASDMVEYEDLIGKEFAYGGRGPDQYDCYGLLREMFRRAGKEVPDYKSPSVGAEIIAMILDKKNEWEEVEPGPGTAMLMRLRGNAHVGFRLPYGLFIHTWERSGGVCVERVRDWEARIVAHYDYL